MRRKRNYDRHIMPDVKYSSKEITKFINNLMYAGNKATIEKFFYDALERGAKENNTTPLEFFNTAIKNATVHWELRSRRVGGVTYQVPRALEGKRSFGRTVKLMTKIIKKASGTSLDVKIFDVLTDNKGLISQALNELQRQMEANKVHAMYRW